MRSSTTMVRPASERLLLVSSIPTTSVSPAQIRRGSRRRSESRWTSATASRQFSSIGAIINPASISSGLETRNTALPATSESTSR